MKKRALFLLLTVCIASLTISCSGDDDAVPEPVSVAAPGSGWKVSLYTEPKENKTSDYAGYVFEFSESGTVTVTGNGISATGTWRQYQDDGLNRFEITINTNDKDLADLNDDWVLESKTATLLTLKDDNAASDEHLQFSK